jgi:hypothetical protein
MSRMRDLIERQTVLQLRCDAQRRAVGREVAHLGRRLQTVDRVALAAKRAVRNPLVIGLVVAALAAVGPSRIVRYASRATVVTSLARRALRALRR